MLNHISLYTIFKATLAIQWMCTCLVIGLNTDKSHAISFNLNNVHIDKYNSDTVPSLLVELLGNLFIHVICQN